MESKIYIDSIEILEFYSYTTLVGDVLTFVQTLGNEDASGNDNRWVIGLFKAIVKWANAQAKPLHKLINFDDNKCCYKVKHKNTGVIFYIGYYDWEYRIGLSAEQAFGTCFDFATMQESEAVSKWTKCRKENYRFK